MSGEIEAIGDLATGGLLAGTVEPKTGASRPAATGACLNCGTPLAGPYCSRCGQRADVHRSLGAFWHDFTHSVFHFDGKIWRTLPLLAWRPGELTRRYVHGERARFVSPFALFLFSIFLMVAVFTWAGPSGPSLDTPVSSADAVRALEQDKTTLREELAKLDKLKAQSSGGGGDWITTEQARTRALLDQIASEARAPVARSVAERRIAVQQRQAETERARLRAARSAAVQAGRATKAIDDEIKALDTGTRLLEGVTRSMGSEALDTGDLKINLGLEPLNALVRQAAKNPQLTLYKIQSNAYKFSWALIPISVPFIWLLFFWRRDLHLFDHAVFVTYSIAFMTLLATAGVMAVQFPQTETVGALLLVLYPPFHLYRHVRGAYRLGRAGAILRTVLLVGFSVAALSLFAAFILALGLSR